MFLDLPALVHTLNLLRWYGSFRNNGVYNTDLYLALFDKIKQKKFKKHVYNRLYVQTKLVQTIIAGLNTIRVMFIKDKACCRTTRAPWTASTH